MSDPTASVFDQSFFQVALDWGVDGLSRLAAADIVVVVDVLRFSTKAVDVAATGRELPLEDSASVNGAPVAVAAAASRASGAAANAAAFGVGEVGGAGAAGPLVLAGCLRNAAAVAHRIVAEQHALGGRVHVAVICAGERTGGATRFAIEDQLGAGAIVAALGDLGIDHTSPEAAVACEAFRSLRGAVRHLLLACGSGQELVERGLRDDVLHAAELDTDDVVPVLRDRAFVAG